MSVIQNTIYEKGLANTMKTEGPVGSWVVLQLQISSETNRTLWLKLQIPCWLIKPIILCNDETDMSWTWYDSKINQGRTKKQRNYPDTQYCDDRDVREPGWRKAAVLWRVWQLPITVVWKDIKAKRINGYIILGPKVLLVKYGESILACNAPLLDDTRKTHLLLKNDRTTTIGN